MNQRRVDFYLGAVGECLIAVGGRNDTGALSSVELYCPAEDCWSYVAGLPRYSRNISYCCCLVASFLQPSSGLLAMLQTRLYCPTLVLLIVINPRIIITYLCSLPKALQSFIASFSSYWFSGHIFTVLVASHCSAKKL